MQKDIKEECILKEKKLVTNTLYFSSMKPDLYDLNHEFSIEDLHEKSQLLRINYELIGECTAVGIIPNFIPQLDFKYKLNSEGSNDFFNFNPSIITVVSFLNNNYKIFNEIDIIEKLSINDNLHKNVTKLILDKDNVPEDLYLKLKLGIYSENTQNKLAEFESWQEKLDKYVKYLGKHISKYTENIGNFVNNIFSNFAFSSGMILGTFFGVFITKRIIGNTK